MKITPEIAAAFNHVKKYHPQVSRVAFFIDSGWAYMDDTHNVVPFSKEIDTGILEDAWASIGEQTAAFTFSEPSTG